jgi:hypothetical protein
VKTIKLKQYLVLNCQTILIDVEAKFYIKNTNLKNSDMLNFL